MLQAIKVSRVGLKIDHKIPHSKKMTLVNDNDNWDECIAEAKSIIKDMKKIIDIYGNAKIQDLTRLSNLLSESSHNGACQS